jgi:alkylated DNA repair protein alkB family protein 7
MHLTSWPDIPELPPILDRLHALFPPQDVQTHLLHLASNGEIQPHIDNLLASGSWILGVSLGAERVLHLESKAGESFQVLLPSGSVYIQRHVRTFQGGPHG